MPWLIPPGTVTGTLRAGYALVAGKPEKHPEGVYYLRFLRNGNRAWEARGPDPEAAIAGLQNKEHDLKSIALGRPTPFESTTMTVSDTQPPCLATTLDAATQAYLEEIRRFRSPKTIAASEHMLGLFCSRFPAKLIKDVTHKDLLDHMSALREGGAGDRTVHNHISRIITLLKAHGVLNPLNVADKPKYDEKDVTAYNIDELSALFSAATADERLLFEFFLGTGFREQEVMFCTWSNVDLKSKVVSVWSKPEMGFRVKDKEERSVPLPDSLVAALATRKKHSTSMLVFPSDGGKPDGHFLRTLKSLAFRASLNCGECTTKGGKSCSTHPLPEVNPLWKILETSCTRAVL